MILGLERANELAGEDGGIFMNFANKEVENWHPIRAYCWYVDKIYIVYWFTEDEAQELI